MAVVDAKYRFVAVDVGQYGRMNDSACFSRSAFGQRLSSGELDLPQDTPLPGFTSPCPHVFVADEAFPLQRHLMRPFPGSSLVNNERKIFNYRLSRARRTVENAFGIMSSRFRVFRRPLLILPMHADSVVKACTVLHNFLLRDESYFDASDEMTPQQDERPISSLRPVLRTGRRAAEEARIVREQFVSYFSSPRGAVTWQLERMQ